MILMAPPVHDLLVSLRHVETRADTQNRRVLLSILPPLSFENIGLCLVHVSKKQMSCCV